VINVVVVADVVAVVHLIMTVVPKALDCVPESLADQCWVQPLAPRVADK
jgi:hypothetical protein